MSTFMFRQKTLCSAGFPGLMLLVLLWLMLAGATRVTAATEIKAAELNAQELIKEASTQAIDALIERREELEQDKGRIYEFVEEFLLPHFDTNYIARMVLGRHGRQATPEERERFRDAFQEMLIRSYAASMLEYSDQEIVFLPYSEPGPDEDETIVRTEIEMSSGNAVSVDYSLRKTDNRWRVYDVTIDGISMVVNYRGTINSEIRRLNGVGPLIERIEERNRRGEVVE